MVNSSPPWVDGEKIPDEQITAIFRTPPGVPPIFYRSCLVIGSRGAGKTTLFRYQKEVHAGPAIHISLSTEFASITQQTGLGPLASDIPATLEPLIIGKAISLLALSIITRLLKKEILSPTTLLSPCISRRFHSKSMSADVQSLARLRADVSGAPLSDFRGLADASPLPSLVSALGELAQQSGGPLLLLLDRADMVLGPALIPVFQLLDQSAQYIAVVAMRPGHASQILAKLSGSGVAGDHYALVHLGIEPRSKDWIKFLAAAIHAQFESHFEAIPDDILDLIVAASRDSIRVALELFARYTSPSRSAATDELMAAIQDLRDNQLASAQHTLQTYHQNLRQVLKDVRLEVVRKNGAVDGPVLLSIRERAPETLFQESSGLHKFVDAGLRCGALCMPEGERWLPGLRPHQVEIPPILLWERGDKLWTAEGGTPVVVTRKQEELWASSNRARAVPCIFVAYRMASEQSKQFRRDLEAAMRTYPNLANLTVTDGHVPAGTPWAKKIRERIKRAKAVVGDVAGLRPDVVFELGFAYGLRKAIIPAVADPSQLGNLPAWLSATQLGYYRDPEGLLGILSSLHSHLADPEFSRVPRPPHPIPSLAVWLRALSWSEHAQQQFRASALKEGLLPEIYSDATPSDVALRRAASAALVVVTLDGTDGDAFMHFIAGSVAARPRAGIGGTLPRTVLVLEEPSHEGTLMADSLRRCSDIMKPIALEQVRQETEKVGRSYSRWATKSHKGKTGNDL